MDDYGLSFHDFGSVTADTTSSSINVFDTVDCVDILPCFGHKANLFLKLACTRESIILKDTFATCRQVMVRLDGKKSHLRKEMLQKACEETNTLYRKPIHPGATRFGSQEKTAQRCVYLQAAIGRIPDIAPSQVADIGAEDGHADSRTSWADLKLQLNAAYPVIEYILPIFKEVEQWTQILSSNKNTTLSKSRVACRRLRQKIDDLNTAVNAMPEGRLRDDLSEAVSGLLSARESHLGHDYYNFATIRVAEFLDVEVFHTIPPDDLGELRGKGTDEEPGIISNFLLEEHTNSPAEVARRVAAAAPRRPGRGSRQPLTEEEKLMELLNDGLALSEVNPLHLEFKNYTMLVKELPAQNRSTLGFWRDHGHKFPILSRVARRVLCASSTSCDVERLFSRAGLICTALRNRLAPRTIQCLTTLHYYYGEEEKKGPSTREKAADGRAKRFATLTTNLLIEAPESYISDSDEDDGDF